jgi:hypothetical protein
MFVKRDEVDSREIDPVNYETCDFMLPVAALEAGVTHNITINNNYVRG